MNASKLGHTATIDVLLEHDAQIDAADDVSVSTITLTDLLMFAFAVVWRYGTNPCFRLRVYNSGRCFAEAWCTFECAEQSKLYA